ncbi:hypothetical protein FXF53_25255 [Micromonospora sp. WP24]|uniref:hypothetical protein n=1 Tax=Micromonospora TaxID=1873 RepID=UPI0011C44A0B|nr:MULTISPECIES: hypothetical protein [Micromonospora]TYB95216.1 hypothetical protein FXF53_25255 [Micromonospora sp. WP24]
MSSRFLTKLAGGVVLGSAALLLAAPATALAAADEEPKEPKASSQGQESKKKSHEEPKTFNLKDKEGNGVTCATTEQANEQNISNIVKDNTITNSIVSFHLSAAQSASNEVRTQPNNIVVCIRDIDVDVDVKTDLLSDLLAMVQAGLGEAGSVANNASAPVGAYAGPDGAWVLPKTAGVAAGDGGSLSDTNTGALTAVGASMMGVGALGGIALLRRRSANGTVA